MVDVYRYKKMCESGRARNRSASLDFETTNVSEISVTFGNPIFQVWIRV